MDSDAIVRARRRQHALDQLEFERDRETALLEQSDDVLTELEGPRIDAAAFELMEAGDVTLVREALDPGHSAQDEDWLELEGESPAELAKLRLGELEAERLRLGQLIDESRASQQALERYIEALDGHTDSAS